jgi:hypothetical protein
MPVNQLPEGRLVLSEAARHKLRIARLVLSIQRHNPAPVSLAYLRWTVCIGLLVSLDG